MNTCLTKHKLLCFQIIGTTKEFLERNSLKGTKNYGIEFSMKYYNGSEKDNLSQGKDSISKSI